MKQLTIILIFITGIVNAFGQAKPISNIEKAKYAVTKYGQNNFHLFKVMEWGPLISDIAEIENTDHSVEKRLNQLFSKDTAFTKNVREIIYFRKYSGIILVKGIGESDAIYGYIDTLWTERINKQNFVRIVFEDDIGDPLPDTFTFRNIYDNERSYYRPVDISGKEWSLTYECTYSSVVKDCYSILVLYEALTNGGFKKYFYSRFYIDKRNFKVLTYKEEN